MNISIYLPSIYLSIYIYINIPSIISDELFQVSAGARDDLYSSIQNTNILYSFIQLSITASYMYIYLLYTQHLFNCSTSTISGESAAINIFFYLSIYQYIDHPPFEANLSKCQRENTSIYQYRLQTYIHPSFIPANFISTIYQTIYISIYTAINLSIYVSIYLSI